MLKTLFEGMRDLTFGRGCAAVTPSDTVDIKAGEVCLALYVGTGGNVVFTNADGTLSATWTVSDKSLIKGFGFLRVMNTNTTASGMIAIY